MREALRLHWPEYLMEAAELGLFMISAGVFGVLLEYPGSPRLDHHVIGPCASAVTHALARKPEFLGTKVPTV